MNTLGQTYIADKTAALAIQMRAAWQLRCIEWRLADATDTDNS